MLIHCLRSRPFVRLEKRFVLISAFPKPQRYLTLFYPKMQPINPRKRSTLKFTTLSYVFSSLLCVDPYSTVRRIRKTTEF